MIACNTAVYFLYTVVPSFINMSPQHEQQTHPTHTARETSLFLRFPLLKRTGFVFSSVPAAVNNQLCAPHLQYAVTVFKLVIACLALPQFHTILCENFLTLKPKGQRCVTTSRFCKKFLSHNSFEGLKIRQNSSFFKRSYKVLMMRQKKKSY